MNQPRNIGPVRVEETAEGWCVTIPTIEQMEPELPPDLERTLAAGFSTLFRETGKSAISLDLKKIPAISSHQLGLMLALQKSIRDKVGKLAVVGVTENVRRLLEMTNTAQFFTLR